MFLELIIKGFIVGIAFIIPGVSGGTLAVYLGIYKKLLDSIGNIFTDFKNSMKFLIPFAIGGVISVLGLAKLFGILIEWNSYIVLMFFIGLLAGGLKHIYLKSQVKSLHLPSLISGGLAFMLLLLVIIIDKTKSTEGIEYFNLVFTDYLIIIGLGIVGATTMIIPGISGSAMLMVLGFYTAIVTNVIGNVLNFDNLTYNLRVLVFFALGIFIGIILFSKLISFLLDKYPKQTYFAILGFIIASIIGVFLEIKDPNSNVSFENQKPIYQDLWTYISENPWIVIIGLTLLVLGYISSQYLTKIELKGSQNES
ncbi:MAG: DUF368 domain-containing protein [Candidatus Izemoplasmatales bacterium]